MSRFSAVCLAAAGGVSGLFLAGMLWKLVIRDRKRRRRCLVIDKVVVINSETQWMQAFDTISREISTLPVVGFDCEWNNLSDSVHPVSLLQLATVSGLCFLLRLHQFENGAFPLSLRQLLLDKDVLKVGVACMDDAQKLFRDYSLECYGCLDLRQLAVQSGIHMRSLGLKSLAKVVLDEDIDKHSYVRRSDWEAPILTAQQGSVMQPNANGGGGDKGAATYKASRAYVARKTPLYHNCQLRSPDGQLLCTCDLKKAMWYLDRGLADKICDEPLTVQLKFEPAGRPADEFNYYLQEKDNVCVVCGSDKSYIRKCIVPHEYRKALRSSSVSRIPATRVEELQQTVRNYFGVKELTDEILQRAENIVIKSTSRPGCSGSVSDHGLKVVRLVMDNEGLIEFERMWRQHFIDTMKPAFLPPLWTVDHSHNELNALANKISTITT